MILRVYTIYDSKVEAYKTPFFARTHGEAIRMVTDAVFTDGHEFAKYAEDYTLFYMCEYDDETGFFLRENEAILTNLGCLQEFRRVEENNGDGR